MGETNFLENRFVDMLWPFPVSEMFGESGRSRGNRTFVEARMFPPSDINDTGRQSMWNSVKRTALVIGLLTATAAFAHAQSSGTWGSNGSSAGVGAGTGGTTTGTAGTTTGTGGSTLGTGGTGSMGGTGSGTSTTGTGGTGSMGGTSTSGTGSGMGGTGGAS